MIISIFCSSKVNKYITKNPDFKKKILEVICHEETKVILNIEAEKFISVNQFLVSKKIKIKIHNEEKLIKSLLKENDSLVYYLLELPNSSVKNFDNLIKIACKYSNAGIIIYIWSFCGYCDNEKNTELLKKLFKRKDFVVIKSIVRIKNLCIDDFTDLYYDYIKDDNSKMIDFLNNNVDSPCKDMFEDTIEYLIYSMKKNSISCVEYILSNLNFKKNIEKSDFFEDEFINCIESDKKEIVQLLLSKINFSQTWINSMFVDCYEYDVEITKMLIDAGADIEKYVGDIIKKAKDSNRKDVVKYLKSYCNEKEITY